jgi:transcriptional regulator with XRE-family HTH domain
MAATLGESLEGWRRESGLSLSAVSRESGIALTSLHRLFRDQVAKPNPAHLVALARVLGVHERAVFLAARYPSPGADLDAALRAVYPVPDEVIAQMREALDTIAARHAGAGECA